MKVVVTGSRGFVGQALVSWLEERDVSVLRLVRGSSRSADVDTAFWDPEQGVLDPGVLVDAAAVIHLAGENITGGRWNEEKRRRIRESRVKGTRLLAEAVASMEKPPTVFVCASAVGFYGSRGDKFLDERSPAGDGFLAEVCRAWEGAAEPALRRGIRTVWLRLGMVLGPGGGALGRMVPLFRRGLGGRLGDGRQYVSWVDRGDVLSMIGFCLEQSSISGPVNAVSPEPVTNEEFTRSLASIMGRSVGPAVPGFALRMMYGDMAEEVLLASARVLPSRLVSAGFTFEAPHLQLALERCLGEGR